MASDYCLNMNCGHHRKDHRGVTGHCTKCVCNQGRYVEAEKGQLVAGKHAAHTPTKRGGRTR